MGLFRLLRDTFERMFTANAFRNAAALSFSVIVSMAPSLILLIALVSFFVGRESAHNLLLDKIGHIFDPSVANTVGKILPKITFTTQDVWATLIGVVLILLGATAVFSQLRSSLNEIWPVPPKIASRYLMQFLLGKAISLLMLVLIAFLLMASLLLSTGFSLFSIWLSAYFQIPTWVFGIANFLLFFLILTLLAASVFKLMPTCSLKWRDALIGAACTSVLFLAGKSAIAFYLQRDTTASVYGAAGSVVLMILWIYYSAAIFFFGACFTWAYQKNRDLVLEERRRKVEQAAYKNFSGSSVKPS